MENESLVMWLSSISTLPPLAHPISSTFQELTVTIQTATSVTMHDTYNVLACTPDGKDDSIIVVSPLHDAETY